MKKLLMITSMIAIAVTNYAQTKLIEKVEQKEGKIVIPYEKYELDNGLTLIIHEDKSDPLVHVDYRDHVFVDDEKCCRNTCSIK